MTPSSASSQSSPAPVMEDLTKPGTT
ncbi:hypothetical protein CEXT_356711, partial [Caerostris extrusa]